MGRRTMPRRLTGLLAAGALALGVAAVGAAPAHAEGDARISHVQSEGGTVQILLDVPANAAPELGKVTVTIGGETARASAKKAAGTTTISRTSVLAIDTSNSMRGARFEAAKAAAKTYLTAVPADVKVGIVTFASEVSDALAPTTDRTSATAVLDGLALSKKTRLYEGITAAVAMAGTEGQRTVLVLSDGADTTKATPDAALSAVRDAKVTLDAVSLETQAPEALTTLAQASGGRTVQATSGDLSTAFSAEAETLSRQVLVTAEVPASFTAAEGAIEVTLPSSAGPLTAQSFNKIQTARAAAPAADSGFSLPGWAMYVAIGLVALGLLLVLGLLLPQLAPKKLTAAERVEVYTDRSKASARAAAHSGDNLASAKEAAAQVLARNVSLDERISKRLDQAGSDLRSSEWLIFHTIAVIAGVLLMALIGGGSFFLILVGLALGLVLPWLYLGFRRSQRVKQFNAALPDTLQLMSGSMAAGLSLAQSVDTIVKEGSEPMASEFKRVLIEARLGVPIEDALEGVTERFASKDFAWVVMAVRIQRQVGGNLAELLDTVAGTIREREYLRRQVATLSAEGKMSAWVLGLLPPLFFLYLMATQGDYVKVMYTTPLGWLMLGAAGVSLSVGAFWMSRLVKVDV